MLDLSGSMGLPSTNAEQTRLAAFNPANYTSCPNGRVFACKFTNAGACPALTEKYNTNGIAWAIAGLFDVPRQLRRREDPVLANNNKLPAATLLSTLPAVTSWPGDGTDACIPLRADAVGAAVQQLLVIANATQKLPNQFRIGLGDGPRPELNGLLQRKGQGCEEA